MIWYVSTNDVWEEVMTRLDLRGLECGTELNMWEEIYIWRLGVGGILSSEKAILIYKCKSSEV